MLHHWNVIILKDFTAHLILHVHVFWTIIISAIQSTIARHGNCKKDTENKFRSFEVFSSNHLEVQTNLNEFYL